MTTIAGDGQAGSELEPLRFSEPGGLAFSDGVLWVADTNNHRILKISMATGAAEEFTVNGLQPPVVVPRAALPDPADAILVTAQLRKQAEQLELYIDPRIPEGFKLNADFPTMWSLFALDEQTLVAPEWLNSRRPAELTAEGQLKITLPLTGQQGGAVFVLEASYGYCDQGDQGLCRQANAHWKIPVSIADEGTVEPIRLLFPAPVLPLQIDLPE